MTDMTKLFEMAQLAEASYANLLPEKSLKDELQNANFNDMKFSSIQAAEFEEHWEVASCHYIIDWNYDEDRSQIRTGFGPENITRLRRFAIGLLKSRKKNETIPEMMKKLLLNTRAVFDCLKMTRNSNPISMS